MQAQGAGKHIDWASTRQGACQARLKAVRTMREAVAGSHIGSHIGSHTLGALFGRVNRFKSASRIYRWNEGLRRPDVPTQLPRPTFTKLGPVNHQLAPTVGLIVDVACDATADKTRPHKQEGHVKRAAINGKDVP
ncbi:hypothetical protein E4U45_005776 [Claviceps purpurea]|nr:hypothetical protein E4U45_005776 [Claviceps purpurea]